MQEERTKRGQHAESGNGAGVVPVDNGPGIEGRWIADVDSKWRGSLIGMVGRSLSGARRTIGSATPANLSRWESRGGTTLEVVPCTCSASKARHYNG